MLRPNDAVDTDALAALLDEEFGAREAPMFVPEGGDSWCYRAGDWWMSVRRDRLGHEPRAYEAACELRDAGYDFVLAPSRGHSGAAVHTVGALPVVVFPYVPGRELAPRDATRAQAAAVLDMIEALHRAHVPDLPRETFDVPFAVELADGVERALAGVATEAGPYARPVTELVQSNERYIEDLRREMYECQAECRAGVTQFVPTHGEPIGNLMLTDDGTLLLMDWGELRYRPAERDFFELPELGLPMRGRHPYTRFYALFWVLGEIAEYVAQFTSPHPGDAADTDKWNELLRYLHSAR